MEKLRIFGGERLYGKIDISASKNAYLPILAASILSEGKVILHNNPHFSDIYNMCSILCDLGSKIEYVGSDIIVDNSNLNNHFISQEKAGLLRSSIFSLGPILGRMKKAKIAYPGGCEIGARPIDIHLKGLEALNVKICERHGFIVCDGIDMRSNELHLDFPSVGATENIMMASVFIKGTTTIHNVAMEPEIVDLQNFLNKLGAKVSGAGTEKIVVEGVEKLNDFTEYTPIPDRIIAGTYLLAGCSCGGEIELKNVNKDHIGVLISKLQNSNCKFYFENDKILLTSKGRMKSINKIETMPYPGFPTDLQSQLMSALTTSKGTSVVVENVFENRFMSVPELTKMGAKITTKGNVAVIHGVEELYGANVVAHDLRGGAGLVLAGLKAQGYTTVDNIQLIDRGYFRIEDDLTRLGAKIKRIKCE